MKNKKVKILIAIGALAVIGIVFITGCVDFKEKVQPGENATIHAKTLTQGFPSGVSNIYANRSMAG